MKVQEIRNKFTKYFKSMGHEKVPSSPLVPINDDTLLFTNAGMNQFKDVFTGKMKPNFCRATTIQKVVRAGGKHNDLENVGLTARHHTFFEMLGNFSFGDYFKKEAIEMAWDFLTKELGIAEDRLYVTVHHTDNEAYHLWENHIGISSKKIFKKGDKDNFWEMGDIGPCGPCSEIFYDHGEEYSTPNFTPGPDQDLLDDEMRYVEIWNLVFMQYEKDGNGGRTELPNKSIDTGMGLERIAAVMQGVYWNYDTDSFTPIIAEIERFSGKSYRDEKFTTPMRVVADHIRSCTMLITDGVIPSNEGRGYVLRRIIRRAVRFLKDLEAPEGSFSKLAPIVLQGLGQEYPQNAANESLAVKFLKFEEDKFQETLDQGLRYLKDAIKTSVHDDIFDGKAAFKLYDTYGFPLDLTELILKEQNIALDISSFDKAMQERKADSKKSWKGSFNLDDKVFHTAKEKTGETKFLGYQSLSTEGTLLEIIDLGDKTGLIFDQTPFYAEGGGQVGDNGTITIDKAQALKIIDTQKPIDGLFVHFIDSAEALLLNIDQTYSLKVNVEDRNFTTRNHSATHLLQAALIKVLGDHVKQSGSMVNTEHLRFDFTHMQALSKNELDQVEDIVNLQIQSAVDVKATVTSMDDALSRGALALFGEKYGESVRVLEMGTFSTELCGGTHVSNTREIGLFTIISESSLSNGVRRIEATTSTNAIKRLKRRSDLLRDLELLTSSKDDMIATKLKNLQEELKKANKEIEKLQSNLTASQSDDLFLNPEELKNGVVFKFVDTPDGSDLRKMSDLFLDKYPNGIVMLTTQNKGKLSILLRSSKKLSIPCNKILNDVLSMINGRGGGRPDMAQGSGDITATKPLAKKAKALLIDQL